jgi:hypothetical protein
MCQSDGRMLKPYPSHRFEKISNQYINLFTKVMEMKKEHTGRSELKFNHSILTYKYLYNFVDI